MPTYSLASNGDGLEKKCDPLFLSAQFPSYEKFWLKHVVPLTNRHKDPADIHFMTQVELAAVGKNLEDVCMAQLHYTVLTHISQVHAMRIGNIAYDGILYGIARLVGALDVAFELLERSRNKGTYEPFLPTARSGMAGSREARRAWQDYANWPLQAIRTYRNDLLHGGIFPHVQAGATPESAVTFVPRIGEQGKYYDWRTVTSNPDIDALVGVDFVPAVQIVAGAWDDVMVYLDREWPALLQ